MLTWNTSSEGSLLVKVVILAIVSVYDCKFNLVLFTEGHGLYDCILHWLNEMWYYLLVTPPFTSFRLIMTNKFCHQLTHEIIRGLTSNVQLYEACLLDTPTVTDLSFRCRCVLLSQPAINNQVWMESFVLRWLWFVWIPVAATFQCYTKTYSLQPHWLVSHYSC